MNEGCTSQWKWQQIMGVSTSDTGEAEVVTDPAGPDAIPQSN
jgi:hypothetical protein